MTPEQTAERVAEQAVAELKEAVSAYAGKLHKALDMHGLEIGKLKYENRCELEDILVQTFIDFAQRCDVPYARVVGPLPRASMKDA